MRDDGDVYHSGESEIRAEAFVNNARQHIGRLQYAFTAKDFRQIVQT